VIEVLAALAGASVTVAAMGIGGASRRNDEDRRAVIKLTAAVEHVATRLETLHLDVKANSHETFSRLNEIEQRLAKVEATRT
jgi:hypothetical protein